MKNKAVKIVIISLASIVAAIAVAAVGAIIYCTMLKGGYIPSESELSLTSTVQNEQPGGETIKIKIRLNGIGQKGPDGLCAAFGPELRHYFQARKNRGNYGRYRRVKTGRIRNYRLDAR